MFLLIAFFIDSNQQRLYISYPEYSGNQKILWTKNLLSWSLLYHRTSKTNCYREPERNVDDSRCRASTAGMHAGISTSQCLSSGQHYSYCPRGLHGRRCPLCRTVFVRYYEAHDGAPQTVVFSRVSLVLCTTSLSLQGSHGRVRTPLDGSKV